jgi:hypothetical protein
LGKPVFLGQHGEIGADADEKNCECDHPRRLVVVHCSKFDIALSPAPAISGVAVHTTKSQLILLDRLDLLRAKA